MLRWGRGKNVKAEGWSPQGHGYRQARIVWRRARQRGSVTTRVGPPALCCESQDLTPCSAILQLCCHPLDACSTFKLGLRELAMMDNLNVWTHACNISVASALLDCFDAELLARFRGKG